MFPLLPLLPNIHAFLEGYGNGFVDIDGLFNDDGQLGRVDGLVEELILCAAHQQAFEVEFLVPPLNLGVQE